MFSGLAGVSDLGVTKTGPDQAAADTDVTYTIEVLNNGPDQGDGATLTDNTPPDTTFVSITQQSGPAWSCSDPGAGNTGTVSCTNAALPAGSDSIFTIVLHINPGTSATFITNRATVSSTSFDPDDENNSGTTSTFVPGPTADVGVTKTADTDQALADSDVTYTITVNNFGPDTATNVQLRDDLPSSQPGGPAR